MRTNKQIKILRDDLKKGDKVRVISSVEAFYSGYAGRPQLILSPDILGTVGAVRVPVVTIREPRRPYDEYVCVDYLCPITNEIQRAAVSYNNLVSA